MDSRLETRWMKRIVSERQTPTDFIDFLIDGASLFECLNGANRDLVGIFSSRWVNNAATADALTKTGNAQQAVVRQLILGCGECGDLGCGGITMIVDHAPGSYTWSEFIFENGRDPEVTDRRSFAAIGPFTFEENEYRRVIRAAAASAGRGPQSKSSKWYDGLRRLARRMTKGKQVLYNRLWIWKNLK